MSETRTCRPDDPPDYNPIGDYALIGDTHSTALIDPAGSVDWLCWPRHDSPALFLRLLDARKGGSCRIEFEALLRVSRRYLPQPNILETRFTTATGEARLLDLMPIAALDPVPAEGPDGENEGRLVRLLECVDGTVTGRFVVDPSFDYARRPARLRHAPDGGVILEGGEARLHAAATQGLRIRGTQACGEWRLGAGEQSVLVLSHGEVGASASGGIGEARDRLERTRLYWEGWSARCGYRGPFREQVLRSALCLKLLTYAPTGAIIAAPTTSLPEALAGGRNYDYRFAWLRDCSFTVTSFVLLGFVREAAEYLRFLRHADPTHGRALRLMYGIAGPQIEPQTLGHLEGWRGAGPVRIGNAAGSQSQLDIYGEFLSALHGFLERVGFDPPRKVHDELPQTIGNLAEQVIRHRDEPDVGIWELNTGPQQILHTKGMNRVALDCAAAIGRRLEGMGLESPDDNRIARWEHQARQIEEDYTSRGWNEERGAYTMAYGSRALDSAALRLVLFGALSPRDPRLRATLARIEDELAAGDLLYRYRMDDGVPHDEAAFTACSFWRAGVLATMGRVTEATGLFKRLLARGNDLGLFAEEIDPASGEQRGNFPQGFSHMAVITIALRIESCRRARARAARRPVARSRPSAYRASAPSWVRSRRKPLLLPFGAKAWRST